VSLPLPFRLPTWIIRFDKKGTCESPETQGALLAKIREAPKPTHMIFMSHGWNSEFADAIRQYQAFLKAFEQVVVQSRHTVYGPTFRTWGEDAGFPRDLLEESLGHQIGTVVERAYRRTDGFDRRRAIMQSWADFCSGKRVARVGVRRASRVKGQP
jgi:integrase